MCECFRLGVISWRKPQQGCLGKLDGGEIVSRYLEPLAALPELARHIHYESTVSAVARHGLDKMTSQGRSEAPFQIRYRGLRGKEYKVLAAAVLDASGTWSCPNPLGIDGLSVPGEAMAVANVAYGIPDVSGRDRRRYADRSVLVVGSGHSAINVVLALLDLQRDKPETQVIWALRRDSTERLFGGGLNDQLPARGSLGMAAKTAIDAGKVQLLTSFSTQSVAREGDKLSIDALHHGQANHLVVDEVVVATGFRPDLEMLRELRVDLDPAVEAPRLLAPMIDPNLHSCGTVPPHGVVELTQPEPNFFIVGSKSYGRAPTFLMATGYEQVRSVVAELAGDHEAARRVQLVLPETGVCSAPSALGSSCCGEQAPAESEACCVDDMVAKEAGRSGCGCGSGGTKVAQAEPAE